MANATASSKSEVACDPVVSQCSSEEVCYGWQQGSTDRSLMGRCVTASVHYVLATSTRVDCVNCNNIPTFYWNETNAASEWDEQYSWPPDPMWTESNWPTATPEVKLYLKETDTLENAVLASGLLLSAATVAIFLGLRRIFQGLIKSISSGEDDEGQQNGSNS